MLRKFCLGLLAVMALGAQAGAQTLTTMFRFNGADGAAAIWKPVADGQGNLYGTTEAGGPAPKFYAQGYGTIYKYTPATRAFETLYNFAGGTDGQRPAGGLVYDPSSATLYGTTYWGGSTPTDLCPYGCGTIFSFNTVTGAYATLYAFTNGTDQRFPAAPLTLGSDGALYGVTSVGTVPPCDNSCGTIFKYDPSTATFTTLHTFAFTDGSDPVGSLVFGKAGKLFGVAASGGYTPPLDPTGFGLVYRFDPVSLTVTVIYKFTQLSQAVGLAADTADNLYATTEVGGANKGGSIIKLVPQTGAPYAASTLFSFDGPNNNVSGLRPVSAVTFDSKQDLLYGTASSGGVGKYGTMYELDPNSGAFTLLHSFAGGTDAGGLVDGILIDLGQLYGETVGSPETATAKESKECRANSYGTCGTLFKYPRF